MLIIKMRDLDDVMRQSSDASINEQVQKNLQQIRNKNKQIVELTKEKEEIESKMLKEVNDKELKDLQKRHSELIKEYENIIEHKLKQVNRELLQNLTIINN